MKGKRKKGEDSPSSGILAFTRLGYTIEEQWPAFKLVGFGFYYAWIWSSYNSSVLVSSATASALPTGTVSGSYLVSTFALSITLILLSLFRDQAERLIGNIRFLSGLSVVVGMATIGIYLSPSLGRAESACLVSCGVLTGIGTAFIVLRFGIIYSRVCARDAATYAAASFFFAGLLYFVAVGIPNPLGIGLVALFPVLAALSSSINPDWEPEERWSKTQELSSFKPFFVRLLIAVAVFSLVVGVARGFVMAGSTAVAFGADSSLMVFATTCVAAALFVVVGLTGWRFDVGRLYYPIIIVVSMSILLFPFFGEPAFGVQFTTAGYYCFILVIWCLLSYIAFNSRISPVLVFGLGRGISALCTAFGWMIGLRTASTGTGDNLSVEMISVAMTFALLIVSMLVLNDRMIGDALRGDGAVRSGSALDVDYSSQANSLVAMDSGEMPNVDPSQASIRSEGEAAPNPRAEEGDENADMPDNPDARLGKYRLRCNTVADKYDLSPRERDVFDLLVRGRSIEYIAQSLTISFNTAKSHIRHIYVKTDVHSRQELLDLIDAEAAE